MCHFIFTWLNLIPKVLHRIFFPLESKSCKIEFININSEKTRNISKIYHYTRNLRVLSTKPLYALYSPFLMWVCSKSSKSKCTQTHSNNDSVWNALLLFLKQVELKAPNPPTGWRENQIKSNSICIAPNYNLHIISLGFDKLYKCDTFCP